MQQAPRLIVLVLRSLNPGCDVKYNVFHAYTMKQVLPHAMSFFTVFHIFFHFFLIPCFDRLPNFDAGRSFGRRSTHAVATASTGCNSNNPNRWPLRHLMIR